MSSFAPITTRRILDRTLDALAQQVVSAGVDWSVLVIDNNSTDDTAEIVDARIRAGKIPTLTMVREPRQGLTHAHIRGVAETRSPWIAFVDDDNLLEPDWIEQAGRFIAGHPSAGMLGGRIALEWEVPPPPLLLAHREAFVFRDYGTEPLQLPSPGLRLPVGAGMVVRRQSVISCGWLERQFLSDRTGSRLASGGDTELALRLRKTNAEIWYVPKMRLRHFITEQRISVPYLCRLYRGFAESSTLLQAIQKQKTPGLLWRLNMLGKHLAYLIRRTAAFLVWDVIGHRRVQTKRLVQVHEGFGYVLGSLRFMFFGFGGGGSDA